MYDGGYESDHVPVLYIIEFYKMRQTIKCYLLLVLDSASEFQQMFLKSTSKHFHRSFELSESVLYL